MVHKARSVLVFPLTFRPARGLGDLRKLARANRAGAFENQHSVRGRGPTVQEVEPRKGEERHDGCGAQSRHKVKTPASPLAEIHSAHSASYDLRAAKMVAPAA